MAGHIHRYIIYVCVQCPTSTRSGALAWEGVTPAGDGLNEFGTKKEEQRVDTTKHSCTADTQEP